jgi:hypothetical protein
MEKCSALEQRDARTIAPLAPSVAGWHRIALQYPGTGLNMINRTLVPTSCNFFFESSSPNNSKVKHAWSGAMGDRPKSSS